VLLQDYEKGVRWRDIRVKVEAADGVGRLRCAVISLVAMITGDPADIIGSSNDALADAVNKAMDSLMAQRKANANAEDAEALLKTTITSNDRLRRALVSLTCACAGDKATGMGEQDGYIVAAAGAAAAGIADERKNADYRVRLTNAKAEGAEKLRQSLASLICACGGDASDASSDGYLIDAASGCADVIMRRRQDKPTPEQMAMAVAEALKSALDQFKKG
jgi:hypothetical protein